MHINRLVAYFRLVMEQAFILSISLFILSVTLPMTTKKQSIRTRSCEERLLFMLLDVILWLVSAILTNLALVMARDKDPINLLVDSAPFELHLPGSNFAGPGTDLSRRLRSSRDLRWRPSSRPNGPVDMAAYAHDVAYLRAGQDLEGRHLADLELLQEVKDLLDKGLNAIGLGEYIKAIVVWLTMTVKCSLFESRENVRLSNSKPTYA